MHFAMGQNDEAVAAAERVIAAAPHHPQAFKVLGTIHEVSGDKDAARKAFLLAVHADGTDVESWTKLGMLQRCVCAAAAAAADCLWQCVHAWGPRSTVWVGRQRAVSHTGHRVLPCARAR